MRSNIIHKQSLLTVAKDNYILTAISILVAAAYLIYFPVVFEQNDDVIMKLIANGYITGQPEARLVFINSIIGSGLKLLYESFSNVEWYSIIMIALLLSCFFTNMFLILKNENGMRKTTLVLLNLSLIYFLSRLQFSYVSGFLAVSAVLIQSYTRNSSGSSLQILSYLFMLFSAMVRLEMFVFTWFPLYALFVFDLKRIRKTIMDGIGLLLIAAATLYNYSTYQGNLSWKKYYEYNKARGSVTANVNVDLFSHSNQLKFGTNEKDAILLSNYIFTESLTTEKFQQISSHTKSAPQDFLSSTQTVLAYLQPYFTALFVLLFSCITLRKYRITLAIALHLLLIIFTIRFVNNVVYRILYPTLFCLIYYFIKSFDENSRQKTLSYLLLVAAVVLNIFQLRDARHVKLFSKRGKNYIQSKENKLSTKTIFVINTESNPSMLSRRAFDNPGIKMIFHGWLTNFPVYREMAGYNTNPLEMVKHPLLIDGQNYKDLKEFINNEKVYIIDGRDGVHYINKPD